MMRNVGKKITIKKYIDVEETVTMEKITGIYIRPETNGMDINVALVNSAGETVGEETVVLSREDYELLMSDDVMFDDGKQVGSYREADLWKMIDKMTV